MGYQPQQPSGPQWPQQPPQPTYSPQQSQYPQQSPQSPYPPQFPPQPQMPPVQPPKKKSRVGLIVGIIIAIVIFACVGSQLASHGGTATTTSTNTASNTTSSSAPTTAPTQAPTAAPTQPKRQVQGKLTTLGAGTFSGGTDVPKGLYDVTAPGQEGNFIVSGTDTYNEIFGQGVTKVRAKISDGDKIELSGLSNVIFTPVSAPFITTHTLVSLYAGTFIVGQDIGAGKYIATTTPGSSGNFFVEGANSVNEILGQNSMGGVPSVTVDLSDGDAITISGLEQVKMTPQ